MQEGHGKTFKKENTYQLRLVYPAKISFLNEGEIKTFPRKDKLKNFMTTKPTQQKILKEFLHTEEETRLRQEDARNNKLF
jgi:hypothetical protein